MLKLRFSGDVNELKEGIGIFADQLGYTVVDDGLQVIVKKR